MTSNKTFNLKAHFFDILKISAICIFYAGLIYANIQVRLNDVETELDKKVDKEVIDVQFKRVDEKLDLILKIIEAKQ